MSDRLISADRFAVEVERILSEVADGIDSKMPLAVREGCKVAKREVMANAPYRGLQHPPYKDGFSYKVQKNGRDTTGEVGNKLYPGMVHLLEKGHATIGGGRVPAYEHMAPAAEKGEEAFVKAVNDAVDGAL